MGLIDLKFVLAGLVSCFKVLHLNHTFAPVCRWENPSTASKGDIRLGAGLQLQRSRQLLQ